MTEQVLSIEERIAKKALRIEKLIREYLPGKEGYHKVLLESMEYSVLAGGKRLRPMLMEETYYLCGGKGKIVEPFMAAMEMIHTYSLVHDDLPAMDNDEYRRGKKTTWAVYGDGMAVLCGDALLNYAFETAMRAFDSCVCEDVPMVERYRMVAGALKVLAAKAGVHGMIGGQTADVEAEKAEKVTEEQLTFIYEHKTADLIEASMMIGAILAGADEGTVEKIRKCAYNIGIAFQIQDDILDIEGKQEVLGKPIGSDEKNHKQTYVSIHGMQESKDMVKKLSDEALQILRETDGDSTFLEELTGYLIHREK